MKININQLNDEIKEKDIKINQLQTQVDQLHHQLVRRLQEPPNANKRSFGSQTIKVGIFVTARIFEEKCYLYFT